MQRQWLIPSILAYSLTKINVMRKTLLRFAFVLSAVTIVLLSACKGGVKDADIEKAVAEKITAVSADATDVTTTVKDGVVTVNGMFKDDASKANFETTLKAMPGVKSVVNNSTVMAPPAPAPAPVEVATVDALTTGVTDATKDFPGVKADVKDGVITLTGDIKRSSLPMLMKALNTLKPKKIDNKLTIK
jgi:hyperosmotically inducible periplasmic protein